MMDQTIKQAWVQALRSGEYRQTKTVLHDGAGFCCLGVLCDLYLTAHNDHWTFGYGDVTDARYIDTDYQVLPKAVQKWAGLPHDHGAFVVFDREHDSMPQQTTDTLAELNDRWGKSFDELADLIEEQL